MDPRVHRPSARELHVFEFLIVQNTFNIKKEEEEVWGGKTQIKQMHTQVSLTRWIGCAYALEVSGG